MRGGRDSCCSSAKACWVKSARLHLTCALACMRSPLQELKQSGFDQEQIDASRAATQAQMEQLRAAAMDAKAGVQRGQQQQQQQENGR